MSDILNLYQELILDHARRPKNFGELENPTHHAMGHNPLCGDKLKLELLIRDNIIQDIKFNGDGCAISKASASLMTQHIKNKNFAFAKDLFSQFHQLLTQETPPAHNLGKLEVLAGVKNFPMRVKCATLCWHALDSALNKSNFKPVCTE